MNIFGTEFDYAKRLNTLRKKMAEKNLDCMIVHNFTNQHYYGGHYQHWPWYPLSHTHITEAPLLLFRDHDPIFMAAFITMNAVREGTWIDDVRIVDLDGTRSANVAVGNVLKEKGLIRGRIGYEEKCCTASTYQKLVEELPEATFVAAGDMLFIARMIKEPKEIDLIRKSIFIAESAIEVAKRTAKPGVTEMDVQFAMEIEMKRLGAMREVETMCQSGIRTANYRAFAAEWKKIEQGDLVTIDLGCLYLGYGCDIARTWTIGSPKDQYRTIARDLYATYDKFMDYCRAGKTFGDVFDYIRGEMTEMGYQPDKSKMPCQQFTIHGIGLGPFHDFPHPTHRETVFEPGMVLSFQPAVRDTKFSIRFEDNILVTETGLELLSTNPHNLI